VHVRRPALISATRARRVRSLAMALTRGRTPANDAPRSTPGGTSATTFTMSASAADDYDFYPCLVDREPASIYVNLRFEGEAPLAGADTRYELAMHMAEPGPHGIGTADEAEALDAVEEAVIAEVGALGLTYVGRLRHRGTWEATFYGPAGHVDAVREATARAGRRADVQSESDPDWRYYRELLLPDAERRRWMDDRRLVEVLRDQGDGLRTPRRVDHRASFVTAHARDAFAAAAARAGFTLERAAVSEDVERPFRAQVARTDAIELDHIHDVVMTLVDAATAHGGHYDGWTAAIERG